MPARLQFQRYRVRVLALFRRVHRLVPPAGAAVRALRHPCARIGWVLPGRPGEILAVLPPQVLPNEPAREERTGETMRGTGLIRISPRNRRDEGISKPDRS